MTDAISHIKSGAVRALAVTTTTRTAVLPELAPIADTVPGYEASAWFGFVAPRGAPAEVTARLSREINAALADERIKARIADLGSTPMIFTPAEFGTFIASETEKWAKAVKFSGATAD